MQFILDQKGKPSPSCIWTRIRQVPEELQQITWANALTLCEHFAFHEELPLSHIQPVSAAGCGDSMKMIFLPAQRVLNIWWVLHAGGERSGGCSDELCQHIHGFPGCGGHSSALFHSTDSATSQ